MMKFLEDASLSGKTVLLRINADVPLHNGQVADQFRLQAVLPTLHFLLDRGARIVLMAHLGRPEGKVVKELSLRPIYLHLSALLKKPIAFAPQLFSSSTEAAVKALEPGQILALENLRFEIGEEKNSRTFAAKLAHYGDLYVNDAFSVSHRQAASVVAIAELLPSYAGLLLEREYQVLTNLIKHPARPYVAVIGGAKISDKLPAIKQLIRRADWILTGGGVANTFLKAKGVDVKRSLIDADSLAAAETILKQARGKLIVPEDFVWQDDQILDLGRKTTAMYGQHIGQARTVFWTGPLGQVEKPEFQLASRSIAEAMLATPSTTIVGGGDTVSFIDSIGLAKQFSFVSTGGGATLELLGGHQLPGIKALE